MWTYRPDYRQTACDAFFLMMFFVSMYGELRSGFAGSGTIWFVAVSWWLLEEKPHDYVV
jgi:hypothetical protein